MHANGTRYTWCLQILLTGGMGKRISTQNSRVAPVRTLNLGEMTSQEPNHFFIRG